MKNTFTLSGNTSALAGFGNTGTLSATPINQIKNILAEPPQLVSKTDWDLRNLRNSFPKRIDTCGTSATRFQNGLLLAELPQLVSKMD